MTARPVPVPVSDDALAARLQRGSGTAALWSWQADTRGEVGDVALLAEILRRVDMDEERAVAVYNRSARALALEWATQGDRQRLLDLALREVAAGGGATPIVHAADHSGPGLRTLTADALLAETLPPLTYVLSPWLATGDLAEIFAERGIGKSHAMLGIGYAVATGGELWTWSAPQPRRVLLVDGENSGQELQRRIGKMTRAEPRDGLDNLVILSAMLQRGEALRPLDSPEGQAQVEVELERHGPFDLVLLDNLSSLTACRENEADDWLRVQTWLLSLRRRGIAALYAHHAGKSGTSRGTSRRGDTLNAVLRLTRPADYRHGEDGARFVCEFTKVRSEPNREIGPFEAMLEPGPDGVERWAVKPMGDNRERKLLAALQDGVPLADAAREVGISTSTAYRRVAEWVESGELQSDPRPRRRR